MRHDGFRSRLLIPLVLLINSQALLATGGELSARDWLERMMDAVQHLNYQGTFIYLHDNQLETMRIVHAVENVDGWKLHIRFGMGPHGAVFGR